MGSTPWNHRPTFVIRASDITQGVKPSQSMKEVRAANPWKKTLKTTKI
jgi:hypothetical protein